MNASAGLAGDAQQVSVDNPKADCKPDLDYPASRVQTNTAGHHELDHKLWIWPSIGGALLGFGLGSISDAALRPVIDSYA